MMRPLVPGPRHENRSIQGACLQVHVLQSGQRLAVASQALQAEPDLRPQNQLLVEEAVAGDLVLCIFQSA